MQSDYVHTMKEVVNVNRLNSALIEIANSCTQFPQEKSAYEQDLQNEISEFETEFDKSKMNDKQISYFDRRFVEWERLCTERYEAVLRARNYPSVIITGPARYKWDKWEKSQERRIKEYQETERRKRNFITNTEKALDSLKDSSQVEEDIRYFMTNEFKIYTRRGETSLPAYVKTSFFGKLSRRIKNGWDAKICKKIFYEAGLDQYFTKRHGIYKLFEVAEPVVEKQNFDIEIDGGVITVDYDLDRILIAHDEKPDADMRDKLKSHAFRWSRRNGAWQRRITKNTVYALVEIFNIESFEI